MSRFPSDDGSQRRTLLSPLHLPHPGGDLGGYSAAHSPDANNTPPDYCKVNKVTGGVWKSAAASLMPTKADNSARVPPPAGFYAPLTNGSASPSILTLDHSCCTPLSSQSPQRSPNLSPSPSNGLLGKSASDCCMLGSSSALNGGPRPHSGGGGGGRSRLPTVHRESCSSNSRKSGSSGRCGWRSVSSALRNTVAALLLLYVFVCSLSLMGSALKLMAGRTAGNVFTRDSLLANPVAGLMVGVLATVLVQSSSTSTSIVVTMVASRILPVPTAIPIVMGANIGTSVTNTIVAMSQVQVSAEFRRAFAGATVHDMFNWLTVLILLPLEVVTHYLQRLSGLLVSNLEMSSNSTSAEVVGLEALTKLVTKRIVIVDKSVITNMAMANAASSSSTTTSTTSSPHPNNDEGALNPRGVPGEDQARILKPCGGLASSGSLWLPTPPPPGNNSNSSVGGEGFAGSPSQDMATGLEKCTALFNWMGLSDWMSGLVLFLVSFLLLCACLILLVKVLKGIFSGPMSDLIKRTVNDDFPAPFAFLTGYVAILVGSVMTVLVQSSSVFTSTLTPLVGLGVIELERVFPLTLGSNIGTTVTGLLAALTADPSTRQVALQIACCHLLFNVTGILIWYPLPCLRKIPLQLAQVLGEVTEKYRWFALLYLLLMFLLAPLFVFALSMAEPRVFLAVSLPLLLTLLLVLLINAMQRSTRVRGLLPAWLRSWDFLPPVLHSLAPWDRCFMLLWRLLRKVLCCSQNQPGHSQRSPARTSCLEIQTAL